MSEFFKKAWEEVISPMMRRPSMRQVAALCYRNGDAGKEVLLVTSRNSGRWILPKGWHEDGMTAPDAAAREAWEEAGVKKGAIADKPVGQFAYRKQLDNGVAANCDTAVFPLKVKKMSGEFPEAGERKREWVSPERAAEMVNEPGLRRILRAF
ncbi:MAG: NUDIX hydrolase [Paracoccaceae bacterium]